MIDITGHLGEFNMSLSAHSRANMASAADRVYPQAATTKQEETSMRLKLLSPSEMNSDQKQTYDESIAGKRGAPPPPMMAWLNSPEMARHATRLGGFLRFDTLFPAKLSEIAILVTARHWTSHYEWYAHKRLALKGGMDPKIIDAIRDRRVPAFDDPKAKMIYEVSKSLHEGHGVSKALYDDAVKELTVRGVVEIIGLCGYYTMVSMTLNTFEFDLPEGQVSELA
jgi:4-carboxymuconolactone decarboxylase